MLSRQEAWELLCAWTPSERLRIHARAVEVVMRDFAAAHGQDVEAYGLAGLLHDADYDQWPKEHPARIVTHLRSLGEEGIARAIRAHYTRWGAPCETLMDKALLASDEITGFVMACALVRPQRLEGLEPSSIFKKLKTPAFAAGVDRDEVAAGFRLLEEALGVSPEMQLRRIIGTLFRHRAELALEGAQSPKSQGFR
jgi:predicted hydrolase (HD superfamily)